MIEEKTGKTCKKLSLDMWMPYLVPGSTNFTVEDAQACNGKKIIKGPHLVLSYVCSLIEIPFF